jgi:prolyl-tRNA synthetase
MRMSQFFIQTLREAPTEAEIASHQLLLRAGFISQLGAGIFTALPLARRSLTRIENILREEMNAIGGQEMTMPVVHPAEIWKETGRWYQIGSEMGRFKDKNDRDMVLAMTHEEVVADLTRKLIRSYKQLPLLIYHIQTKWRDDPRPRAGLIRVREFTMKDSYSLDRDAEGLDRQYRNHYQSYFNIFRRCGLPVVSVKSDVGMMGGKLAHEFMYLSPVGEDTLLLCDHCGYTANRQVATFRKPAAAPETAGVMTPVATPNMKTIDELCTFLNVGHDHTAKAVFMVASIAKDDTYVDRFVFAVVRGDMDVNETKLTNAVGARDLRPARDEEIRAVGAVPGYASPVGLKDVMVVVDDAVTTSPNLVSGANREGYHLLNVNYGRDFSASLVADIASAEEGSGCPMCGSPMRSSRGVEVGNIFKLGTRYTEAFDAGYLGEDGEKRPVVMGSYGIGVGRLLACIAEEHHDDKGLIWPISVAPFQVHMVGLNGAEEVAERLYADLQAAELDVLFDDRQETAGVKFNDADLVGIPIRLTVGKRALKENAVEMKLRSASENSLIPMGELVNQLKATIARLEDEIRQTVQPVPYNA